MIQPNPKRLHPWAKAAAVALALAPGTVLAQGNPVPTGESPDRAGRDAQRTQRPDDRTIRPGRTVTPRPSVDAAVTAATTPAPVAEIEGTITRIEPTADGGAVLVTLSPQSNAFRPSATEAATPAPEPAAPATEPEPRAEADRPEPAEGQGEANSPGETLVGLLDEAAEPAEGAANRTPRVEAPDQPESITVLASPATYLSGYYRTAEGVDLYDTRPEELSPERIATLTRTPSTLGTMGAFGMREGAYVAVRYKTNGADNVALNVSRILPWTQATLPGASAGPAATPADLELGPDPVRRVPATRRAPGVSGDTKQRVEPIGPAANPGTLPR